jgi:hypothetical protein
LVFCINAFIAIFSCLNLVEIGKSNETSKKTENES